MFSPFVVLSDRLFLLFFSFSFFLSRFFLIIPFSLHHIFSQFTFFAWVVFYLCSFLFDSFPTRIRFLPFLCFFAACFVDLYMFCVSLVSLTKSHQKKPAKQFENSVNCCFRCLFLVLPSADNFTQPKNGHFDIISNAFLSCSHSFVLLLLFVLSWRLKSENRFDFLLLLFLCEMIGIVGAVIVLFDICLDSLARTQFNYSFALQQSSNK